MVAVLGTFITAAALGTGVVLHIKRPRPPLDDVETLSPAWSAMLWEELRRGVDQQPPWEEDYRDALKTHRRWMNVVGFLVVVGLLTAASSLLIRGPRVRRPVNKGEPGARPRPGATLR